MSKSKWAETSEASHRKNKRAKFKATHRRDKVNEEEEEEEEPERMMSCSSGNACSPLASPERRSWPRRRTKSTFWTIVIAFMTTQLISLCDPLTTTSASSSPPASTGLQSNNNRHNSVLSLALAGSPPTQHAHNQRGHIQQQQHQHQHQSHNQNHHQFAQNQLQHQPQPVSSTASLIQNSWPASYARASRQQQFSNSGTGSLISQSASLLPPSESSSALHQHSQQQPMFHQIAPLSMYHQPQPVSGEQAAQTSRTLQAHQPQAASTSSAASQQLASSSQPANYYDDSASESESQDGSESGSTGSSSSSSSSNNNNNNNNNNNADQLISSGTQELGQEAPLGAPQSEPQDQFQSARERCRELISLTLLSFKDLTPNERASEEIDCATLREQIAAATGRTANSAGARRQQQQQQPSQVLKQQTASLPIEPQEQPSESIGAGSSVDASDASSSSPSQLPPDEFPLQFTPAASLNNQRRPLVPVNPPPAPLATQSRQSGRGQASLQSQSAPTSRKQQQLQPTAQAQLTPLLESGRTSGAQQELAASQLANDPQQQFFQATKWEPKSSYINQVQALLLQQQQQQQSQRAQEHQNMLQFYKQLAAVQRQHSQPQLNQPPPSATFASLPATTTTTTTTSPPPTTLATTFESMLETTTMPPTTTSTTTTTTTTTTARPNEPKIRVGAPPGRRPKKQRPKSTTTTTTTTTTTQKPSTMADYADSSDVSTDYYEDDEEQSQQQTTTTTTTRRPRAKGKRRSTTPKPSTTTTTLSPGYQPRPDGRIIDYMADPNFPRELKGADLTNYPFYISVPEKIDFDCKGRHDGYYSNIDLHCQIYHHCAIGNRYDFLCPNYTLFDQTTFTCRFVNTVDCEASTKHYDKNNALYVEKDKEQAASSSSSTTTTTSTTQAPKLMSRRTGAIELPLEDKPTVSSGSASSLTPLDRISALALVVQQQRQMRANGGFSGGGNGGGGGGGGAASPSTQSRPDTTIK